MMGGAIMTALALACREVMIAAAETHSGRPESLVGWAKARPSRAVPTEQPPLAGTRSQSSGRPKAGPVGFAHPARVNMIGISSRVLTVTILAIAILSCAALGSANSNAAEPSKVTIVVFTPPSLGSVFPAIIKQQKYDIANGLDISFVERPPDAYAAQFNSGEFKVGGSASVLILGLGHTRGIKISYLFNLFDYWGTAVTNRSDIKTLADLKGRQVAAAKGTTNFTVFEWFARQQGVDPKSLQVLNTATPGLIGYALADRADAVQIWEPAYSMLLAKRPGVHTIDLNISKVWHDYAGGDFFPNLGVAAHQDWIEQNRQLIPSLYRTYKQAAEWIVAHPAEAAPLVAPVKEEGERKAIADMIRDNSRLAMNLYPASKARKEIEAVYRMGIAVGLFKALPDATSVYGGKLE
jgi:ABC-type nitrate/sulfonate/bicarbonate transport system substrate-binding protein